MRNADDIQGPLKEGMDNRQPSGLGETLRVPDHAVHRLNGSGVPSQCDVLFVFEQE